LGQQFDLGMLYNMRTDKLIAGKRLWSPKEIYSNVNIVPCRRANTNVDCANKISEQIPSISSRWASKIKRFVQ
jgi:hypothetical protein